MAERWPNPLKLEVKVSRSTVHHFSERDLKGVASDGYVAVLIAERLLHGPRWLLVPANQLQAHGYENTELCPLGESVQPGLCRELNRVWSDWILDDGVWEKLFQQDHMKIKSAIEWCLQHHPPRANKSSGNLREGRLAEALRLFRAKLDQFLTGANSPQQEGFIHQYLLAHALEKLGYHVTVNPVGVPDISATLINTLDSTQTQTVRDKLLGWQPTNSDSQNLRDLLLQHSDETLETLRDILD
jgi:hypothetical protein